MTGDRELDAIGFDVDYPAFVRYLGIGRGSVTREWFNFQAKWTSPNHVLIGGFDGTGRTVQGTDTLCTLDFELISFGKLQSGAKGLACAIRVVKITAPDQTSLLIDFLSEALSLGHIHQVLFCGCTIHHLSETTLHAEIMGIPNTTWDRDIKAVTYHEAELIQSPGGGWETTIILDI